MLGGEGRVLLPSTPSQLTSSSTLACTVQYCSAGWMGGDTGAGFLSDHQADHRLFEITPEGVEALNI